MDKPSELLVKGSKALEEHVKNVKEYCKRLPGFFSPHKDAADFFFDLGKPVVAPLAFFSLSVLCAAIAAFTTLICIISLIVTGFAALAGDRELKDQSLSIAAVSGLAAVLCPTVAALSSAIMAIVSFPYTLAQLFTRTGTTLVNGINNIMNTCCFPDEEEDSEFAKIPSA